MKQHLICFFYYHDPGEGGDGGDHLSELKVYNLLIERDSGIMECAYRITNESKEIGDPNRVSIFNSSGKKIASIDLEDLSGVQYFCAEKNSEDKKVFMEFYPVSERQRVGTCLLFIQR